MLEKKRSTIYEKFCEEVARKMADEVAANRELCDLDVVNAINESNQKFRDDIILFRAIATLTLRRSWTTGSA